MSAVTVSHNVQQHRAFSALDERQFSVVCIHNRKRIHSVDAFCMHLVHGNTGSQACYIVISHCLSVCAAAHGISVVHNVKDDRQIALESFFPEGIVLIHGREVHRFVYRPASDGSVSDVADNNAFFLIDLLKECAARRNRAGPADNCVVRINAERHEKQMHGVAEAFGKPGLSAEEFSNQPVQEKLHCQLFRVGLTAVFLHNIENSPVENTLNSLFQFLFREFLNGGKPFGKHFTVAAVAAEHKVFRAKAEGLAYCCRLFSDIKVCRPRVHILHTVEILLGAYGEQHVLKLTDITHVAPDGQEVFFCKSPALELFLCRFLI